MKRILALWWLTLPVSFTVVVFATGPIVDLKIMRAQQDLVTLRAALDSFESKYGGFPSEQDGLRVLVGTSLIRTATDPWGKPYVYRRPSGSGAYRVYSRGVDGRDDIGSGDDVTTATKTYRCEDYGVNCPPTLRHFVVGLALVVFVASLFIGLARIGRAVSRRCAMFWRADDPS